MLARLIRSAVLGLFFAGALMPHTASATELLPEPQVSDNGLHIQPWFHQSFLDLKDDLAEAKAAGKGLVILFEQSGCPYCREMHKVNLRRPDIVKTIQNNFIMVQLDFRGSREVTDLDGKAMEERDLARRWGVVFTPTMVFFSPDTADDAGKIGRDAAAMIVPGYFKPFHFETMFEYVAGGHYKDAHFQNFIVEKAEKLRAEGQTVDIW